MHIAFMDGIFISI